MNNNNEPKTTKTKTKTDSITILSYVGIGIFALLILLPPVFKLAFPKEEVSTVPTKMVKIYLKCTKNELYEDYTVMKEINNQYEDNILKKSVFMFVVASRGYNPRVPAIDTINIEEVNTLKSIDNPNIVLAATNNSYVYTLDYKKYNFDNIEALSKHNKIAPAQITIYQNEGYRCDTTSETVDIIK